MGELKLICRVWMEVDIEIIVYNEVLNCEVDEVLIVMVFVLYLYGLICGMLLVIMRGSKFVIIMNKNFKFVLNIVCNIEKYIIYVVLFMLYIMGSFLLGMF